MRFSQTFALFMRISWRRQTPAVEPMLAQCCSTAFDADPPLGRRQLFAGTTILEQTREVDADLF